MGSIVLIGEYVWVCIAYKCACKWMKFAILLLFSYNTAHTSIIIVSWTLTLSQKQTCLVLFPDHIPTLAFSGGTQCPNSSALQEVRNCNEHACTVYHWQAGPWDLCAEDPSPSSGNTTRAQGPCFRGVQTRKVICVRVGVGQVPLKK